MAPGVATLQDQVAALRAPGPPGASARPWEVLGARGEDQDRQDWDGVARSPWGSGVAFSSVAGDLSVHGGHSPVVQEGPILHTKMTGDSARDSVSCCPEPLCEVTPWRSSDPQPAPGRLLHVFYLLSACCIHRSDLDAEEGGEQTDSAYQWVLPLPAGQARVLRLLPGLMLRNQ